MKNIKADYGVLDMEGNFTPCNSDEDLADLALKICNERGIKFSSKSLTDTPYCALEKVGYVNKRVFWDTNWENRLYDMDRAGLTLAIGCGFLSGYDMKDPTQHPSRRYITKEQRDFMYSTVDSLGMLYYLDENFTSGSYGIPELNFKIRLDKIKELKGAKNDK